MKKFNYFFSSLLGFIPSFFIWNTVGSGINKFIKESEIFSFTNLFFSKEIYFPIIMFIILILISFVIKNKIFNVKHK